MFEVTCDFEDDLDVDIFDLFEGDFDSDEWVTIGIIKVNDIELNVYIDWDEGDFFVYVYGDVSNPSGELSGRYSTARGDITLREGLRRAIEDLKETEY